MKSFLPILVVVLAVLNVVAAQVDLKKTAKKVLDDANLRRPSAEFSQSSEQTVRNNMVKAVCIVERGEVRGQVTFEQEAEDKDVTISYRVTGLTPGAHGFHIHEKADFSDGCKSAGPHYNPFGKNHGGPKDEDRHVGDMGNIVAGENGVAEGTFTDRLINISGEYSVIGRSVMVHEDPDDLGLGGNELSLTTGNAGGRIACGEITTA